MGEPDTPLLIATSAAVGMSLIGPILRFVLRRRGRTEIAKDLLRIRLPVRFTALSLVALVGGLSHEITWLQLVGRIGVTIGIAGFLLRVMWVGQEVMFRRLNIDAADNLRARSRRTRIDLLRRAAAVVVFIGTVVVLLLTLTPFRSFGPTVVAYAGLIGAVLGLALREPLENLVAGITVAFNEAVRVDDVVVIDGHWGRIEEIGLVNVVVRIWDQRRLVVPTSRLVNEAFENWTHRSSDLLAAVTVWVDHTTNIDALRVEVIRIVEGLPEWNGRSVNVQVVELARDAVQVRILVSARDADSAWELRCEVREQVLDYLCRDLRRLPVLRVDRWNSNDQSKMNPADLTSSRRATGPSS